MSERARQCSATNGAWGYVGMLTCPIKPDHAANMSSLAPQGSVRVTLPSLSPPWGVLFPNSFENIWWSLKKDPRTEENMRLRHSKLQK